VAVEHQASACAVSLKRSVHIVTVCLVVSQISLLVQLLAPYNVLLLHGIRRRLSSHLLKQAEHVILPLLLQASGNAVAQIVGVNGNQIFKLFNIFVSVFSQNFL